MILVQTFRKLLQTSGLRSNWKDVWRRQKNGPQVLVDPSQPKNPFYITAFYAYQFPLQNQILERRWKGSNFLLMNDQNSFKRVIWFPTLLYGASIYHVGIVHCLSSKILYMKWIIILLLWMCTYRYMFSFKRPTVATTSFFYFKMFSDF